MGLPRLRLAYLMQVPLEFVGQNDMSSPPRLAL